MSEFVDPDDGVEDVVKLIAVDLPNPATMAFGLEAQFPRVASLMVAAHRTELGFKVRAAYDDERVKVLRSFGMLPAIGHKPTRESIAAGFYLGPYARLVRRELILLRRARG